MKPGNVVRLKAATEPPIGLWNKPEGHLYTGSWLTTHVHSWHVGLILATTSMIARPPSDFVLLLLVNGRIGWQLSRYFEDASAVDARGGEH